MRKLTLLLVLLASQASAQGFIRYYPPAGAGGAAWDGGAFTDPAEGPDGCTNPAYGFGATDTDAGLCLSAANTVTLQTSEAAASNAFLTLDDHTFQLYSYGVGGAAAYGIQAAAIDSDSGNVVIVSNGQNRHVFSGTSFYSLTPIVLEGTTADDFETTLTLTDPTADRTITLPDATGDVAVIASAGFPVRTGSATWATRSFTSGDGSVVISNPAGTAGDTDLTVDSSVFSRFSSGTGDASGACSPGTFHIRTDTDRAWFCTDNSPTWTAVATGAGSASGANTVDVTLAGTPDYITISGQQITRGTIDVADLSTGTDGNLITWDSSGNPAVVVTGDAGQVLTSNGAGAAPTFEDAASGSLDITSLTAEPLIQASDPLPFYDVSAAANRKVVRSDLTSVGRAFWAYESDFFSLSSSEIIRVESTGSGSTVSYITSEAGRPGIQRHSTGTTTTGRSAVSSHYAETWGTFGVYLGDGIVTVETAVRVADLSDGTDTYSLALGMSNCTFNASCTPTDAIWLTYTDSVNSGKWRGVCTEDSASTNVDDTGTAVAAATWYRLGIVVNAAASSAEFFVNGSSIGSCGSNVPDTGDPLNTMFRILKSAGTTARTMDLDYVRAFGEMSTTR